MGDAPEAAFEFDVAVERAEPVELGAVCLFPVVAREHGGGELVELAVEVGELDLVPFDVVLEACEPLFDLAPRCSMGDAPDRPEAVELTGRVIPPTAGAVSSRLLPLTFLPEPSVLSARVGRSVAELAAQMVPFPSESSEAGCGRVRLIHRHALADRAPDCRSESGEAVGLDLRAVAFVPPLVVVDDEQLVVAAAS